MSASLKLHSNKMFPPNCLKTFSYRCFSRLLLTVCSIRFTQFIFSDHMNRFLYRHFKHTNNSPSCISIPLLDHYDMIINGDKIFSDMN